jgi:hypothetical protein
MDGNITSEGLTPFGDYPGRVRVPLRTRWDEAWIDINSNGSLPRN